MERPCNQEEDQEGQRGGDEVHRYGKYAAEMCVKFITYFKDIV